VETGLPLAHRKETMEKSFEQLLDYRVNERMLKGNVAQARPQDDSCVTPYSASKA
jgi:hypothetical protein